MTLDIQKASDTRARLAEGPLWDERAQALYWIDAIGGTIYRLDSAGREQQWTIPGAMIGSITLGESEGAIVTLNDGFYSFDFATGVAAPIALPEKGNGKIRFNDGKVDRQGRLVAGTVVRPGTQAPIGKLYQLSPELGVKTLEEGIHVSNGPCFSPDGAVFYFADTLRSLIWAYDYDCETGQPRDRRVFFDATTAGALTDGATVDSDGCLWVALVTAGQIARITPQGKMDRLVPMPVPHPSSVMFGGPDLKTLFVTSIRESESGRFKPADALSGSILSVRGLGATGLPETRFAGSPRTGAGGNPT